MYIKYLSICTSLFYILQFDRPLFIFLNSQANETLLLADLVKPITLISV